MPEGGVNDIALGREETCLLELGEYVQYSDKHQSIRRACASEIINESESNQPKVRL